MIEWHLSITLFLLHRVYRGLALILLQCTWLANQLWPVIRRSSVTATSLEESGTLLIESFHSFPDILNDNCSCAVNKHLSSDKHKENFEVGMSILKFRPPKYSTEQNNLQRARINTNSTASLYLI